MSFHEFQNRLECLRVLQSPSLSSIRSENQHICRIPLNIQTPHKLSASVLRIQTYVFISLHQFCKPPVRTRTLLQSSTFNASYRIVYIYKNRNPSSLRLGQRVTQIRIRCIHLNNICTQHKQDCCVDSPLPQVFHSHMHIHSVPLLLTILGPPSNVTESSLYCNICLGLKNCRSPRFQRSFIRT